MDGDPLEVDPETMRRLGYQAVDWLVDRAARRREEPVLQLASSAEMAERVPLAAPETGEPMEAILAHLARDVLPFRSRIDHPRYLAYVPGEGSWPGVLGDLIASAYNIDVGNWMESSGPSRLETAVLGWFADWIGYPATSGGVLVSGGSAGNLTALACAREALVGAMRPDLVVYVSEQGHSSLARACRRTPLGGATRRSPVLTSRSACFARWTVDQALSRRMATDREVQSLDHIDWPRLVLTPVMSAAFAVGAHRYAAEHGLGDFYLPALIACAPATMLLAWYIVMMEARTRPGSPAAAPIGIGLVLAAVLSSTGIFVVLMLGASGFGAMFLARLHALRRRRVH